MLLAAGHLLPDPVTNTVKVVALAKNFMGSLSAESKTPPDPEAEESEPQRVQSEPQKLDALPGQYPAGQLPKMAIALGALSNLAVAGATPRSSHTPDHPQAVGDAETLAKIGHVTVVSAIFTFTGQARSKLPDQKQKLDPGAISLSQILGLTYPFQ